jgi:hypothetical protein
VPCPRGDLAGPLHGGSRLLLRQGEKPHQHAHAFDAAMLTNLAKRRRRSRICLKKRF